jgi:outer membrane protein OmpA-like peptidoglycan-associated protein
MARESGWTFDTSASFGGGAGVGKKVVGGVGVVVGAGVGKVYMTPPGGGQVTFNYSSFGAGPGVSLTLPKLKTPFDGVSGSTKGHLNWGTVLIGDGFKGTELAADDFTGVCFTLELSASAVLVGGSGAMMWLGFTRSYALYLLSGIGTGQSGADLSASFLNLQTSAKALLPMAGVNTSIGIGGSLIGSVGYWDISSVEATMADNRNAPIGPEELTTKYWITAQDTTMRLAGDGLFLFDKDTIMTVGEARRAGVPPPEPELQKAGAIIKSHPGWTVILTGHTDSVGPDGYNWDLSYRRAKTVAQWFIAKGYVKPANVRYIGMGKTQPAEPNTTARGRRANRRVMVRIAK